jgi:hypothetical protein
MALPSFYSVTSIDDGFCEEKHKKEIQLTAPEIESRLFFSFLYAQQFRSGENYAAADIKQWSRFPLNR